MHLIFNKRIIITFTILLSVTPLWAGKWPWQRRIGRNVEIHHKRQHQRVHPNMWPKEPESPTDINEEKFANALRELCGGVRVLPKRAKRFTDAILTFSNKFDVDPFLVAGLIYDQSRCLPKTPDREIRYGLSRIDVKMHAPHVRGKKYNYWIKNEKSWEPKFLEVPDFPFNQWKAANPKTNIYWTCAFLAVYKDQMPSLQDAFETPPYRHYVSHWFFGDNVRNTEPEDRVLSMRRRMLQYYQDAQTTLCGEYDGFPLVCPLDGAPRMVLDDFGRRRGNKRTGKKHLGTDFVSELDEPIRAMADGKIIFSGVDIPGAGSKQLEPEDTNSFNPRAMGSGGRYVAIRHPNGLRTYYMHMDTVSVTHKDMVKAGDLIGTVGRSGATESGPHLHLEFRVGNKRLDPTLYMQQGIVDPKRFVQKENSME